MLTSGLVPFHASYGVIPDKLLVGLQFWRYTAVERAPKLMRKIGICQHCMHSLNKCTIQPAILLRSVRNGQLMSDAFFCQPKNFGCFPHVFSTRAFQPRKHCSTSLSCFSMTKYSPPPSDVVPIFLLTSLCIN